MIRFTKQGELEAAFTFDLLVPFVTHRFSEHAVTVKSDVTALH
jgi:hypothetical protein